MDQKSEESHKYKWHNDVYKQICFVLTKYPNILINLKHKYMTTPEDYRGYKSVKATFPVLNPTEGKSDFGYHHPYLACSFESQLCKQFGISAVELSQSNDNNWIVRIYIIKHPDAKKEEKVARPLSSKEFIMAAKLELFDPIGISFVHSSISNDVIDKKFDKYLSLYKDKTKVESFLFAEEKHIYNFYDGLPHYFTNKEIQYFYNKLPTWERAMLCNRLATRKAKKQVRTLAKDGGLRIDLTEVDI